MSSVKHIMFLSKNVKTPLLLEVKVGFVYGLKKPNKGFFFNSTVSFNRKKTEFLVYTSLTRRKKRNNKGIGY